MCPVREISPGCEAIGLIYVDPVGTPVGAFADTTQNIREIFARMGFDDRMTVSAIGGGYVRIWEVTRPLS